VLIITQSPGPVSGDLINNTHLFTINEPASLGAELVVQTRNLFVSLVYCVESTVCWFVVREKHCWMAADSADKSKRTGRQRPDRQSAPRVERKGSRPTRGGPRREEPACRGRRGAAAVPAGGFFVKFIWIRSLFLLLGFLSS
jgi:hypothetical protein